MAEISKKNIVIWAVVISVVLIGTGLGVGIPLYNFIKNQPDTPDYINVSIEEANFMINNNTEYPDLIILDVRQDYEYTSGHINESFWLPWNSANNNFDGGESVLLGNETINILVYCNSGSRSARASQFLINSGFIFIYNMWGGIQAWIDAGYYTTIS